jgi:ankyrin repeat protein
MAHRLLLVSVLASVLLTAPAFAQTPERARAELEDLGARYSVQDFLSAVRAGDYPTVKLFLISGMNPNITDENGMTPLMYAAQNNDEALADILRRSGADPNAAGNGQAGKTALIHAIERQKPEMIDFLLRNGADANKADRNGMTPLMYAARKRNLQIVKYLLSGGADVNAQARDGRTALIVASQEGNADIVKALLAAGANLEIRAEKETARDYAWRARNFEVAHILEQAELE